jgi:hypothetical protein
MCTRYALDKISTLYHLSDLDLAYINLNDMFYTCSNDNDHLCFNSSINNDLIVRIHISHIFIWTLTPMWDLGHRDQNFACHTRPHNGEHLCQVILKSLYACRSFAPDKHFSISKCDLDLWPRDLVHVRDTASHSDEHFYEVSLKFLNACRRHVTYKIKRRQPGGKL